MGQREAGQAQHPRREARGGGTGGWNGANPFQAEYDEAFGPYEQADLALQAWKRAHVQDRIDEVTAEVDADGLREGFERVRAALETYRVAIEETRGIILDTGGLDGQALGYDGRADAWYDLVVGALDPRDEGLVKPGLTPLAQYKVQQNG